MRLLTKAELRSEALTRLTLRGIHGAFSDQIVALIAEMIDLSRENVPDCYVQTTIRDEWDPVGKNKIKG